MSKVVVIHDGHPTYAEIVRAVVACMRELGHETTATSSPAIDITADVAYLVIGSEYAVGNSDVIQSQLDAGARRRARAVLWYQERLPLPGNTSDFAQKNLATLMKRRHLYDYVFVHDAGMLETLRATGLSASLAPVGYHESFEFSQFSGIDRHGALFVGAPNDRREAILHQVGRVCDVEAGYFLWGVRRDYAIGSSKILLNVHHDNYRNLEASRFMLGIANKSLIISEPIDFPEPYHPACHYISAESEDLPEVVAQFLSDDVARNRIVESSYEYVRSELPMSGIVKQMAEALFH